VKDFEAVSLVSSAPLVLACHASLGVATPGELISLARAKPGTLTYGTSAVGGAPHLAAELFQSLAGVTLEHVRYSHTERLYDDLEAGRIALTFNNMMSMLPRCGSGAIRALGVTSARRSAAAGHLPTLAECGLGDYEVSNWLGLVAPRGTPANIVRTLSVAAAAAVGAPEVEREFVSAGVTPRGSGPAELAAFIERELARWGPIVARFRDTQPATEGSTG
jgi:tripartite-type tricarboxylate transporter receptor subunit TctC